MKKLLPLCVVLLFAVGLIACGGEREGEEMETETMPTATVEPTPLEQIDAAMLETTGDETTGEYLVDVEGRPLYMFTADASDTSNCTGECAQAWPPLTTEGEPVLGGTLDPSLVGTVTRDDGTTQVTYGGWPLYYFAEDTADAAPAGQDVEGFGGEWYLVTPDGEKFEASEAETGEAGEESETGEEM